MNNTGIDPHKQGEDTAHIVSEAAGPAAEGRYQEVLTLFDKVPETGFSCPEVIIKRALTLDRIGLFSEAVRCCEKAICRAPPSSYAWFARRFMLYYLFRASLAIDCLDMALSLDPAHTEAWFIRGNCTYEAHDPSNAVATYKTDLPHAPTYPKTLYNRGVCLADMERFKESLARTMHVSGLLPGSLLCIPIAE